MSEIAKEMSFEFTMETDGSGLWTASQKEVLVTKIELLYNDELPDGFEHLWGELRVYFNKRTWDTNFDGLIYTDKQFLDDLKGCLEVNGLDDSDISYSEQGMQGDDFVSCDVGHKFIDSWIFKEWSASELAGK